MKLAVTFRTFEGQKKYLQKAMENKAEIFFKEDYADKNEWNKVAESADVLLSWNPSLEGVGKNDYSLQNVKFIQLMSAGFDHVQLNDYPSGLKIACNKGAYAEPMAEHVVAMMLAQSKRLFTYHKEIAAGEFKQLESQTKFIKGSTVGIVGFGEIGKAVAKLLRPYGVHILAINSSGKTNEAVDFVGTLADLDYVLKNSDTLVITIALNNKTEGLINREKLELMKNDAVLVNVARGAIIDEKSLYEHLKSHPDFYAALDAWWVEPFKYKKFELDYPFFELPNLLGSPHNSALVYNNLHMGTVHAVENLHRYLSGKKVEGLIN
ncbi:MAG TPA: 2-hydroxyacid dehydrogenase [Bacteroidales bacterium]|nr:2-hydroxyacid dehydrogenase [Bacteroidales bacterium]